MKNVLLYKQFERTLVELLSERQRFRDESYWFEVVSFIDSFPRDCFISVPLSTKLIPYLEKSFKFLVRSPSFSSVLDSFIDSLSALFTEHVILSKFLSSPKSFTFPPLPSTTTSKRDETRTPSQSLFRDLSHSNLLPPLSSQSSRHQSAFHSSSVLSSNPNDVMNHVQNSQDAIKFFLENPQSSSLFLFLVDGSQPQDFDWNPYHLNVIDYESLQKSSFPVYYTLSSKWCGKVC
ncbi:hypothetical protein GEMRC1_009827 [Eukaryota sp. GEM-RC1]